MAEPERVSTGGRASAGSGLAPVRTDATRAGEGTGRAGDGVALSPADGATLARYAADTVRDRLVGTGFPVPPPAPVALHEPGASFVTLESHGRLRGCIGSLEVRLPLYLDTARNARRAMTDPRMPPVTVADWATLRVTVTVLGDLTLVPVASRAELRAALRPGVDGLLLTDGVRRATFLPVVWHRLTDPDQFLDALLRKGGWAGGDWPAGLTGYRYPAAEYQDAGPRPALW